MSGLTVNTKTDFPLTSFPEYVDPFTPPQETRMGSPEAAAVANPLVEKVKGEDVDRHPSPQPTHVSSSFVGKTNGNGHRVLRSATVGYVAPEFTGKKEQMAHGELTVTMHACFPPSRRPANSLFSQGLHPKVRMDP